MISISKGFHLVFYHIPYLLSKRIFGIKITTIRGIQSKENQRDFGELLNPKVL